MNRLKRRVWDFIQGAELFMTFSSYDSVQLCVIECIPNFAAYQNIWGWGPWISSLGSFKKKKLDAQIAPQTYPIRIWGWSGAGHQYFLKIPRWLQCAIKVRNPCVMPSLGNVTCECWYSLKCMNLLIRRWCLILFSNSDCLSVQTNLLIRDSFSN